jgi:hypothetical protein
VIESARTGRTLREIEDFPENLKERKRKSKNLKYAYLFCLDPQGRFKVTMNIITGKLSFGMRPTSFYFSETMTPDKWVKIDAARSLVEPPNLEYDKNAKLPVQISRSGHLAKKSYVTSEAKSNSESERLRLAFQFYRNQFLEKIKAQRKAYRLHLRALRRRR